jgi:hypothetical protein
MKFLISQVTQWGEELDALRDPDPGKRKVGKRDAVLLLAKKLQAAARRGFTTAELLEVLAAKGLHVHVDLLREALRAAGKGTMVVAGRGGRGARASTGRRAGETTAGGREGRPEDERPLARADVAAPVGMTAQGEQPRTEEVRAGTLIEHPTGAAPETRATAGPPRTSGPAGPSPGTSQEGGQGPTGREPGVDAGGDPGGRPGSEPALSHRAAGKETEGDSARQPAARGSFIPRSDSEVI